jgi:hypothetical protein
MLSVRATCNSHIISKFFVHNFGMFYAVFGILTVAGRALNSVIILEKNFRKIAEIVVCMRMFTRFADQMTSDSKV